MNWEMSVAEWRRLADRQMRLACKESLTDDDKDELRKLLDVLEDHPLNLTFEELIELNLETCPEWIAAHIQDRCWEWLWWANSFNQTVEESCSDVLGLPGLSPKAIERIKATEPYPEGWAPEGRR